MASRTSWTLSSVVAWAALAASQTFTPTNFTNTTTSLVNSTQVQLTLSADVNGTLGQWIAPLLPFTPSFLNNSLQGATILFSYDALNPNPSGDVAYLACDPQAGNLQPTMLFNDIVAQSQPQAIILYSMTSDYCNLTDYTNGFSNVFSILSQNSTKAALDIIYQYEQNSPNNVGSYIKPLNVTGLAANNFNISSGQGGGNGAPTTAIAMIILYTVTGIITLLFLSIIITGAVRAHRHPERYGLRAVAGRPRRSRAQGIARAMLDSLPIVKFGEREGDDANKPSEIELGNATHAPDQTLTNPVNENGAAAKSTDSSVKKDDANMSDATQSGSESPASSTAPQGSGIAAAATDLSSSADVQGCSICTEDFERGQDQRVLPCDHRFHPACIDPWLLNVSGTCPLCRIDLRQPRGSQGSAEGEDEGDEEGMAPPLDMHEHDAVGSQQRMGVRRSIMVGLMGLSGRHPENMSREERLMALRELRRLQALQRQNGELPVMTATPEEESRMRTRLRSVFNVRSRRAGREEETAASEDAPSPTTATAREQDPRSSA